MPNLRKKPDRQPPALSRLFFSFLRLGTNAFGGPAMIAYIRELAVEREQWLRPKTFQEGVALCQTILGATAMQVAAYVSLRVRGVRGAITSSLGFGLLGTVTIRLALHIHWDWPRLLLAGAAFAALRAKIDLLWVVLAGATAAGFLF